MKLYNIYDETTKEYLCKRTFRKSYASGDIRDHKHRIKVLPKHAEQLINLLKKDNPDNNIIMIPSSKL